MLVKNYISLDKLKTYLLSCDDCEKEAEIKTIYKFVNMPKGWITITYRPEFSYSGNYEKHYRCSACVVKLKNESPNGKCDTTYIMVDQH